MAYIKREFTQQDFNKVSMFLMETYRDQSSNWHIDRWNFCRYCAQTWEEVFDIWPKSVGMWVDEKDDIMAIVQSESKRNGEVFFQMRDIDYSESFLNELLDYAEMNFSIQKEGENHLYVRVNNACKEKFEKMLGQRDYIKELNMDIECAMELNREFKVELPEGFSIDQASLYSAELRAIAHGKSFADNDSENPPLLEERIRAFKGIVTAPDYCEKLDFCIIDREGKIAAFTTLWFDEYNKIGIVEPAGTILKYRRMGLGKAIIYEGANHLKALGATKLHVGSGQDFYKAIGFKVDLVTNIWHKVV